MNCSYLLTNKNLLEIMYMSLIHLNALHFVQDFAILFCLGVKVRYFSNFQIFVERIFKICFRLQKNCSKISFFAIISFQSILLMVKIKTENLKYLHYLLKFVYCKQTFQLLSSIICRYTASHVSIAFVILLRPKEPSNFVLKTT